MSRALAQDYMQLPAKNTYACDYPLSPCTCDEPCNEHHDELFVRASSFQDDTPSCPSAAEAYPEYNKCDCGYTVKDCHCPLSLTIPIPRYLRRFCLTPTASGKTAHGYLCDITDAIYDGMNEFQRGSGSMAEEEDIILDLVEKARDISHVMTFVVRALIATPNSVQRDNILKAEKQYAIHCEMVRAARDVTFLARCKNKRVCAAIEDFDSKLEEQSRRNRVLAQFIDKKVEEAQRAEEFYLRLPDLIADGHILYTTFNSTALWDPVVWSCTNIVLHKNDFPNDETKWTVTMKEKE
jgi:hypothetical protein